MLYFKFEVSTLESVRTPNENVDPNRQLVNQLSMPIVWNVMLEEYMKWKGKNVMWQELKSEQVLCDHSVISG